MNAVVLDGFTVNPGDLSWDALAGTGITLTVYDRTAAEEVPDRCADADIVISNKVIFSAELLARLPRLKLISVLATGHNVIDGLAARKQGIVVCNVPAYGTASVAQHTLALLLAMTNQVQLHAADVRSGGWADSADWCYTLTRLVELDGKTMGIVGFGHIGQQVARLARALGMHVLFYTPSPREAGTLAAYADLDTLFAQSDVISLHCPLTSDNQGFVNKRLLELMKKSAYFINTARGQLVNERDLADALNAGRIAGAALDVLAAEPPSQDNPLIGARNCLVTPHNAWMSAEARQRVMDVTQQNIAAFLKGEPVHCVN